RALSYLNKSNRRSYVHHSRIDKQTTRIDGLRARGYVDFRADRVNLSVANNYCSVLNISTTNGNDVRIANRKNSTWRRDTRLSSWCADLLGANNTRERDDQK